MTLTTHMREALKHAPLRRTHGPNPSPWPANPNTLHALERHGLLEKNMRRNRDGWPMTVWTITRAGEEALNPPPRFREDRPVWLAWTGTGTDWTQDPGRRADDAERLPEARETWRRESEQAWRGAQDARKAALVLGRGLRKAS